SHEPARAPVTTLTLNGKEGVAGSSPAEGFKSLQIGPLLLPVQSLPRRESSSGSWETLFAGTSVTDSAGVNRFARPARSECSRGLGRSRAGTRLRTGPLRRRAARRARGAARAYRRDRPRRTSHA